MLNRKSLIVVVSLLSSSSLVTLNNSYAAGTFADHEAGMPRRAASAYPGLSLRGLLVAATAVFSSATYTREEGSKSMSIVSGRGLPYVAAGADYAATGGVGPLAVTSYNPLDTSFLETAFGGASVADHGSSLTAHRSERDAVIAGARSKLRGGSVLDASDHDMLRDIDTLPELLNLGNFGDTIFEKTKTKYTWGYYKSGEEVRVPGHYHYTIEGVIGLEDKGDPGITFHITQYFDDIKKVQTSGGGESGLFNRNKLKETVTITYKPYTHHRFLYTIPKDGSFKEDQLTFKKAECIADYTESGSPGSADCFKEGFLLTVGGTKVSGLKDLQQGRAKRLIQELYALKNKNVISEKL